MDFFVVPAVLFRPLNLWLMIDHGRCRIIHFDATTNPAAQEAAQQLREAFPNDSAPRYLMFDKDAIFSDEVSKTI